MLHPKQKQCISQLKEEEEGDEILAGDRGGSYVTSFLLPHTYL